MTTPSRPARSWVRLVAGKGTECPVCGHDGGCMVCHDGTAAICIRVQDGCAKRRDGTPITAKGDMGWLHRLDDRRRAGAAATAARLKSTASTPKLSRGELDLLIKQHRTAVSPARLERLAGNLSVSTRSLRAYGIGFDARTGCWSFPMYDGKLRAIGIRLRGEDGRKLCVPGSSNGLFVPDGYSAEALPDGLCDDDHPLLLVMPEGPTDACAAMDLGFRAIGRPSNTGGREHLRKLLEAGSRQDVVIIADHDPTKYLPDGTPFWPGWEGALAVAGEILPACGSLRVIKPPEKMKDLRLWVQQRGQAGVLRAVIEEAERVTPQWLRNKQAEVVLWKQRLRRRPA